MTATQCTAGWCDQPCDGKEHNWSRYTPARLSHIRGSASGCSGSSVPNVGVAVRCDEEELPGVVVHIVGGGRDAEAGLTWHDAVQLRQHLDEAIGILGIVVANGFALQSSVVVPMVGTPLRSDNHVWWSEPAVEIEVGE